MESQKKYSSNEMKTLSLQKRIEDLEKHNSFLNSHLDKLSSQYSDICNSKTWRSARFILKYYDALKEKLFKEKNISENRNHCASSEFNFWTKQCLLRRNSELNYVIFTHDCSRTGAPLIALNIAKNLKKRGYSIHIIAARSGELYNDFLSLGPIDCVDGYLSNQIYCNFSQDNIVEHLLEWEKIDGIIVNSAESHQMIANIGMIKAPKIWLIHEFLCDYSHSHARLSYILESFDAVVFPSQITLDDGYKILPQWINKMSIMPQGIFDDEIADYPRESVQIIKCNLGIPQDAFVVLGVGYVDYRKGCDIFNKTALSLQDNEDIWFVWVGNIKCEYFQTSNYILEILNESKSIKRLIYTDAKKNARDYIAASNCLFLSSRKDPFPCVVLESLAESIPVIYFEGCTGSVDILKDDAGIAAKKENHKDAAEKILELYNDRAKLKKLGKIGCERVRNFYCFSDYVDGLLEKIVKQPAVKPKVFLLYEVWSLSGACTAMNTMFSYIQDNYNFDITIVFTVSHQNVLYHVNNDESLLPNLPMIFLSTEKYPTNENKWSYMIDFFEKESPCIVITGFDFFSNSIVSALSNNIGVIGVSHADSVEYYEHFHRLGRYFNRNLCVSNKIKLECDAIDRDRQDFNVNFTLASVDGAILKNNLDVVGGPINIIYTGRIVKYQKRVHDFYNLVTALDDNNVDYTLTIVGEGDDDTELYLKKMLEMHISSRKVYLKKRCPHSEVFQMLSKAHFFMLLSDFEGLSVSMVEAMSQGCLPVMFNMESNGGDSYLKDGCNALIMDTRNYDEWAKKVKEVASNSVKLKEMRTNAVQTVRDKFCLSKNAKELVNIMEDVFYEVNSRQYVRPEVFKWKNKYGDVLPPQWL